MPPGARSAFAATAVTIPAGAAAERMSLRAYFFTGIVIAWVYSLFGHWAWGGALFLNEAPAVQGFLRQMGFHDFAGSTVVHSVGGWFALAAAITLKARNGRFQNGAITPFPSRSRGYAVLGVFMLWFGWWGFNGGSQLSFDLSIAQIILNTNIAGAAAGFSACAFAHLELLIPEHWHHSPWLSWWKRGFIPEKTIGGVLGGLVAITAPCFVADPTLALFVGLAAGVAHNVAFDLLLHFKIDDPVGAVPVHAACGILGTLAVAFAPVHRNADKTLWHAPSFGVQALGVAVAFALSFTAASLWFRFLRRNDWLHLGEKERAIWVG